MKPALLLAAWFLAGGLNRLCGQTLEVTPQRVMMDESAVIRASGLQPNERVVLRAALIDGAGQSWGSQAEFIADGRGVLNVSKQIPVTGSYREMSPMGLIWSMLPVSKKVARYQPPRDFSSQTIELSLVRNGTEVSNATLVQLNIGEAVQRVPVHEGRLRGELFLPGGSGRYPGVLVVGGSEGGMPVRQASWLATHGFAALALAYFRYQDLPARLEAIPLEYFQDALNWLSSLIILQPSVQSAYTCQCLTLPSVTIAFHAAGISILFCGTSPRFPL